MVMYDDDDRPEMIAFVPPTARTVLDVGCWHGAFGSLLKRIRSNVSVTGIEPNPEAASTAASRLDRVIAGEFPSVELAERFDCIVFNDVLEHLILPQEALIASRGLLNQDGVVVASIPNVRHLSVSWPLLRAGSWTYTDAGLLDRTHLRFYTRSSLPQLFAEAGLTIRTITPINITPPRAFGRLGLALGLLESRTVELRAMQYAVVATQ